MYSCCKNQNYSYISLQLSILQWNHTLLAFGITIDKLPGKLFFYNRCQTLFELVWNMFEIGLVVLVKKDL